MVVDNRMIKDIKTIDKMTINMIDKLTKHNITIHKMILQNDCKQNAHRKQ
jgi:hypothetical protein